MLIYVSIQIVTFGRQLIPWNVVELCEEDQTFADLFCVIKAGQFNTILVSDDLKCARLIKIFVGNKPEALMVTAPNHRVFTVCMQFGTLIKFSVDLLAELATPVASSPSTSQQRNAFAILTASQKQLQLGDNGLPFCVKVKDKRDRMYNDILALKRKMGVRWTDPLEHVVSFSRSL